MPHCAGHLVEVHVTAKQPTVLEPDNLVIDWIVLVCDLADEFLGHVLDGEDTGETAVLVDDQGHLFLGVGQLGEDQGQRQGRRHDDGPSAHRSRGAGPACLQKVLEVHHAE